MLDDEDGAGQRTQIGKRRDRFAQRKPDRERAMDQAQRLEQIDIDVGGQVSRESPAAAASARSASGVRENHAARSARRFRRRSAAPPCRRRRAAARCRERQRQHVVDQMLPDIRRGLHRQRDDAEHGRRDKHRGQHGDRCRDPSRACRRVSRAGCIGTAAMPARGASIAPASAGGSWQAPAGVNCRIRPCPPASKPPCGWRRFSRSAAGRR